ncbi:FHA domain-containing protein [Actinomycetospora termitidis]|uniref:FHA domain-containing protein n=1 Tax=Actinomycetospora termitidis TaxID=3053470 RepID=A0ABT7ME26_9PSEU|nr:FHA domain-containing protein [Actinomycetospora sp. Odt1-22]MDL5158917.1 FHA domain-containing protein [Actinomycetospora sp. Odt1-22]
MSSDRARFLASGARDEGVEFPGDYERRVELTTSSTRIGRRSRREPSLPELDLTGPPTDPGISRRHARLLWEAHGWTLLDLGSSNGTDVNRERVEPHRPKLLASGDTIGLGLWTLVRLVRADGGGGNDRERIDRRDR